MFKQFINNFAESQVYLIISLWIFLVFFILVVVLLTKMSKQHINHMSNIPLNEKDQNA